MSGSPARCAASTSAVSSPTVNWAPSWSVSGVANPREAITLTTSTPRSACSVTAARGSSCTSPPRKWQWPPGVVSGGPDATTRGRPGALPEGEGAKASIAQTPDRRHPSRGMGAQRISDHRIDGLVGHRAGALQPTKGRIRDQVGVAVE